MPERARWSVLVVLDNPDPYRRDALMGVICGAVGVIPFADDIDVMGQPLDEVPATAADYGTDVDPPPVAANA
jgi:hypothetical protein